ncbi:MAG: hypothetical protein KAU26_05055 [Methylococcales bacterium]|nr:hypothetical protein [Methylococcales bacterium]
MSFNTMAWAFKQSPNKYTFYWLSLIERMLIINVTLPLVALFVTQAWGAEPFKNISANY